MRNGAFAVVALLLGSCAPQTTSLDSARKQFLEALADYQACLNATGIEFINPCEPKRLIAEGAERAYKDAMSNGVSSSPQPQ
jgi:hypothetical protein